MKKVLVISSVICVAATALLLVMYVHTGMLLWLLITAATFSYHLLYRLLVAVAFQLTMKNKADCSAYWFREKKWEPALYEKLHVRIWENKMPTFSPRQFSTKEHSWLEIAEAMCQSEVVHEVCAVLSFLPFVVCVAMHDTEDIPVFLITSLAASLFDVCFVIIQRYNRPRILGIAERIMKRKKDDKMIEYSHPVFPVPDIERTAQYYVSVLGFRRSDYLKAEEPHICLYCDNVEIILTQAVKKVVPNRELYGYGYDAYFITGNQAELQEKFLRNGAKIVRQLQMTDYQNSEFVLEDCDGRWLAFGVKQKT